MVDYLAKVYKNMEQVKNIVRIFVKTNQLRDDIRTKS